jgi:hypothetical protein
MTCISQFVVAHWFAITSVTAYLFLAAVATMPAPGDPQPLRTKFYVWFYDFLHLVSNKVSEKHPGVIPPAGEQK